MVLLVNVKYPTSLVKPTFLLVAFIAALPNERWARQLFPNEKNAYEKLYLNILKYLKDIKPDIVIITGHDAYYSVKGNTENQRAYKNSDNFAKEVKIARNYEKSYDKLKIIAGACQSNYEELIKAGANFA